MNSLKNEHRKIEINNGTLNVLPIVVDSLGEYLCRNGMIAVVDTIKDHSDDYRVTRFNCKGFVWTTTKTGKPKRRFTIWHESGRFWPHSTCNLDIVSKVLP